MADTRETMSSLLSIASSGLQAAQLRLNASAHNVANLNTPGFKGQTVQQQAVPPTGGVQARTAQAARPGVALEAEAVEQITASYAFKANALVLRTADDMAGTLLDTLA
ncbi:MAG TPA: flagellar basal body protein [Alicycliphilus sp.]|jgi:flagellar hook-associated protein FlgK|nr:flagellar basal body protein [Alicycliphilus sp.]